MYERVAIGSGFTNFSLVEEAVRVFFKEYLNTKQKKMPFTLNTSVEPTPKVVTKISFIIHFVPSIKSMQCK